MQNPRHMGLYMWWMFAICTVFIAIGGLIEKWWTRQPNCIRLQQNNQKNVHEAKYFGSKYDRRRANNIFYFINQTKIAIAKIPAYFSPSRTNPNLSLKDCLDLASRMFLFLSIISFSRMPARTSFWAGPFTHTPLD